MRSANLLVRMLGAALLIIAAALSYGYAPGLSDVALGVGALILVVTVSDHLHLRKSIYVNEAVELPSGSRTGLKLNAMMEAASDNNNYLFAVEGMPIRAEELSDFIAHSVGEGVARAPISDEVFYSLGKMRDAIVLYKGYILRGAPDKGCIAARELYRKWVEKGGVKVSAKPASTLRKNRVALLGEVTAGTRFIASVGVEDQNIIDSAIHACSARAAGFALGVLTNGMVVISS